MSYFPNSVNPNLPIWSSQRFCKSRAVSTINLPLLLPNDPSTYTYHYRIPQSVKPTVTFNFFGQPSFEKRLEPLFGDQLVFFYSYCTDNVIIQRSILSHKSNSSDKREALLSRVVFQSNRLKKSQTNAIFFTLSSV